MPKTSYLNFDMVQYNNGLMVICTLFYVSNFDTKHTLSVSYIGTVGVMSQNNNKSIINHIRRVLVEPTFCRVKLLITH